MMQKLIICLFFLFYIIPAKSQVNLTSKDFSTMFWASKNENQSFYKNDTISLIRISENTNEAKKGFPDLAGYFGSDFIEMEFQENNKMKFAEISIDGWSSTAKNGQYTWRFNQKKQKLSLYFNGKLFSSFILCFKDNIEIKSSHTYLPAIKAVKVSAIRCNK